MADDLIPFGDAVKRERIKRRWTAEEAAERAGLAYKTWLRIESGRPVRNLSWERAERLLGPFDEAGNAAAAGRGEALETLVAGSVAAGRMRVVFGFGGAR